MKKILMLLAAAALAFACNDDDNHPAPGPEEPAAAISVGNPSATATSISFTVTPLHADRAAWVCIEQGLALPDAEGVLSQGSRLEKMEAQTVTALGLKPETEYVILAAAKAEGTAAVLSEPLAYSTGQEETNYDYDVHAADGFFAYDGLDEASGHYRTNIIFSSKKMSANASEGYIDVLVYAYTAFEPATLGNSGAGGLYREFFTGPLTPFYTNGVGLTQQMYYIGTHFTDEEGANIQGCGWWVYDAQGNDVACFAADDTDRTTIEIVENADGTHTIEGVMYDKTLDKSCRFEFTTEEKGIFAPNI